MRRAAASIAALLLLAALPSRAQDPSELWRAALIRSGPADREEPPHLEAMHEWWFITVQNRDSSLCGPWQAMVSFVADAEAAKDELLFTAVVGGRPFNFSQEFPPGSLVRSVTDAGTSVALGDSSASGSHPSWSVHAKAGGAQLNLTLHAGSSLWRRSAPEGWGELEITFAARAGASGSLAFGGNVCDVIGTGYYEHVWGSWSRVPMWGVDFLNAHLDGGWAAYVRNTPMRGEESLYPRAGLDAKDLYPPAFVLSDGHRWFEAEEVTFRLTDSTALHPKLGVPLPGSYTVIGTHLRSPDPGATPPARVELSVTGVTLATILFPTTSSGVLEGWGTARLSVDGSAFDGTSEVELQRFGTTFPH